jgi:hypothetical protein
MTAKTANQKKQSATKIAQAEGNRKYSKDQMRKYRAALTQAEQDLAAGRITQLQYSTRIGDRAVSGFRYHDRVRILEQEAMEIVVQILNC